MRIGVDARPFEARPTGVGRYLEGLLGAWLAAFPGDTFVLLSPRPVSIPEALSGRVEAVTVGAGMPGTAWLQTHASRAAVTHRAEAFWGPLGILPVRGRLPGVATVHDLTPLLHPEWHDLRNRLGFAPFIGPTVRRASQIAAISEATRRDLVARFPEAAVKCTVVPNGVAPFPPPSDAPAPNDGRPYVLYLGTLEPRKNVPRLVEALESVWDRRPDFPDLVLAGGAGWGLPGFLSRLERSRHATRIRHAGYVTREASAHLLRHARLLAYPSLYEGFGLPPLEAMALGTVVVGSSSSSLPEVIGDAGLLPDPLSVSEIARAVQRANDDETWRVAAARRGLERAARFTWDRAARSMRTLFERAIG